jgi:hypothetical protein
MTLNNLIGMNSSSVRVLLTNEINKWQDTLLDNMLHTSLKVGHLHE